MGLEGKEARYPHELSGGEQQRVAIARAVVKRPSLILADEPTGNLDSEASDRVMELITRFHRELGLTIVLITHNEQVAARADRLLRMRDGRLLAG